jgi:phosphatidylserine decarboxylase
MIRIAPEGWPFIIIGAVGTGVAFGLVWAFGSSWAPGLRVALQVTGGILALFTLFSLYFFRNPAPDIPSDESLVLAPGEGRVIQIIQTEEPAFLQGPATRISIFLSVFNVHVQRAPISGKVAYLHYNPGKYLAAWNPKASEENEQASVGILAGEHKVLVRQIAGLVARRVVTDPGEGDPVARGERIGIIRFGSRVDLFLPPSWEVTCREGDRVKVGESVVARIPSAPGTG